VFCWQTATTVSRRACAGCSRLGSEGWLWSPTKHRCSREPVGSGPTWRSWIYLWRDSSPRWLRELRQRCPGLKVIVLEHQLLGQARGPLHFRLVVVPAVVTLLALRASTQRLG
jgi:hypothetical protein